MKSIVKYLSLFKYIPMIIRFLWKEDRMYVISIFFESLFLAISPFPGIYLVKYTIDMISESIIFSDYVVVVIILLVLILLTGTLKSFFNAKLSRSRIFVISSKLANNFYAKSMNCKYENLSDRDYLNKRELAKIFTQGGLSRLSWDIINLFSSLITIISSVYLLASVDVFSIIIIIFVALIESKMLLKKTQVNRENQDAINILSRKYNYYSDACCDSKLFKDIKIFDLSSKLMEKIQNAFSDIQFMRNKNIDYENKHSVKYNIIEFLMMTLVYLLISINILYFNKPIGYFVIALNVINLFKGTLMNALSQFSNYYDNIKCMEYYMDYMQVDNNEVAKTLSDSLDIVENVKDLMIDSIDPIARIEFKHVYFKYPEQEKYALEDINVIINKNDSIALIGFNGAGKTTFLKLLMRLYDVTSGQILINGIDIKNIDLKSYLSGIAVVFQDFKVFSFTIKENITALSLDENEVLINDVLLKADLAKKISTLPNGINTYIQKIYDKNGIELSGGEQQRLVFGRAIYKYSAKVIIFDEPTASLDSVAEHNLYKKYKEAITNNISFFVSHRLSCVNICNKIMMFENGRLVAYGSHNELLEKNAEYKSMYEIQSKSYA